MCKTYFIEEICETICVKNTFSCCVTFSIKFVYHVKTGCLKRSSCFQVIKCRNLNSNNIQNFTGKSSHFIIYCSMHVCPPLLLCVGGLDGLCTCVCVCVWQTSAPIMVHHHLSVGSNKHLVSSKSAAYFGMMIIFVWRLEWQMVESEPQHKNCRYRILTSVKGRWIKTAHMFPLCKAPSGVVGTHCTHTV